MDKDRDKVSKASFILYNSYRAMVNKLSDEDAGALMKAIFALAAGGRRRRQRSIVWSRDCICRYRPADGGRREKV